MKTLTHLAAALALAAALPAQAALVTGIAGETQNFDDAATYDTSGPTVQIGASLGRDVRASSAGGTMYFGPPAGAWSLGPNGEWTSARSFVGVDGDFQDASTGLAASLYFDFGFKRVREVGGFLNFDPSFTYGAPFTLPVDLYIGAFDAQGMLIEEHFIPLSTPGAIDEGAFFGISANTDIARFEVSGPYAVLDNLTFRVPEPGSLGLMGLALGALALRRRRA
jgi:hypothetical protein